jgi:hypothetical protein
MITKNNLGAVVSNVSRGQSKSKGISLKAPIGKVYGIITTPDTPTKEMYEKYGKEGGIGTIFYKDYSDATKNDNNIDYYNIGSYKTAKPFFSNIQDYPLIGELVLLTDNAPSVDTQANPDNNASIQTYYFGTVNLWNNPQQNSPSGDTLGKTFSENADIRNLLAFEGDRIYQGRKGNGIRFGSTVKAYSDLNEWSSIGNDGDPIMIVANGYVTSDTGSLVPNIEEVNKEMSSIYMTSTQKIPLIPGAIIKNPFNTSIPPENYVNSQIILNSDRITINSKKDEVLLFAQSNIELSTDNIINLNAGKVIHLHINEKDDNSRILLGTNKDGTIPDEPVLLGGKTHDVLLEMCNVLTTLASFLSSVIVPTNEGGELVMGCNMAGEQLLNDVENIIDKLSSITSDKVYTI